MLADCINDSLLKGSFPDSLKLGNTTPVCKKDEPTDKGNYRLESVLPQLLKIFERLIYDQQIFGAISEQCAAWFQKSSFHSICSISFHSKCSSLLQEQQNELHRLGFVGTILMDLSKTCDCLPHDLLIAKFEAYSIGKSGLNFY